MKLLFVTQKIDEQDDDLAFVTQWVDEFIAQGFEVSVICLQKGSFDERFPVYSLGKESGSGILKRTLNFLRLIAQLKYDSVFVHMNPEYFTLGGWYWLLRRKTMFLWYTHYTTHIHLKIAGLLTKNMFAATKQSLPQYDGNKKKIVTGHGIDLKYWQKENQCSDEKNIVMVHRLSRSKRVEIGIETLALLPQEFTLTIYGRPIDDDYFTELQELVAAKNLTSRVFFKGPVPMPELRDVYKNHRIMINMATETIDKTMLEAMSNGVFPVTTARNLEAIGIQEEIVDTPEKIAQFIQEKQYDKYQPEALVQIVKNHHSLAALIRKISVYIKP